MKIYAMQNNKQAAENCFQLVQIRWGGIKWYKEWPGKHIFTMRHYAHARSLLSPGVCPSVCHVGALYPDGWRYRQTSYSAQ